MAKFILSYVALTLISIDWLLASMPILGCAVFLLAIASLNREFNQRYQSLPGEPS